MEDGIRLLELARNAGRLFVKQAPHEKKRLLNLVLSNCQWDRGEVRAIFRQPFDFLSETTAGAATHEATEGTISANLCELSGGAPQPELRMLLDKVGY